MKTIPDLASLEKETQQFLARLNNEQVEIPGSTLLNQCLNDLKQHRYIQLPVTSQVFDIHAAWQSVYNAFRNKANQFTSKILLIRNFLRGIILIYLCLGTIFFIKMIENSSFNLPDIFQPKTFIVIIFSLLLLSVFFSGWANHIQSSEQKARHKANEITDQYAILVWKFNQVIGDAWYPEQKKSEERSIELLESIHQFIQQFQAHNQGLNEILAEERKHLEKLSASRKEEIDKVLSLSAVLNTLAHELSQSSAPLSQIFPQFQGTAEIFKNESQRLHHVQNELLTTIQNINDKLVLFEKNFANYQELQVNFSDNVTRLSERNIFQSQEMSESIHQLNKLIRQISENQISLQNTLDDQIRANDGWIKSVQKTTQDFSAISKASQSFSNNENNNG